MLGDVGHPHLHPAVSVQGDGISYLHVQQQGELFREDDPILGKGNGVIVGAVTQVDKPLQHLTVFHHLQGGVSGIGVGLGGDGLGVFLRPVPYQLAALQRLFHLGPLAGGNMLHQPQLGGVAVNLLILLLHHRKDGGLVL